MSQLSLKLGKTNMKQVPSKRTVSEQISGAVVYTRRRNADFSLLFLRTGRDCKKVKVM